MGLILPGDPLFDWTLLSALPPDWRETADSIGQQCAFVVSSESGLLKPATNTELDDYLYGGEYDVQMADVVDELDGCL